MKHGDNYTHYKGGEYIFSAIAIPMHDEMIETTHLVTFATAKYHENTHEMDLFTCEDGAVFIDSDIPHVIYQSKADEGTDKLWAREVDDFFGFVRVDGTVPMKRFSLNK